MANKIAPSGMIYVCGACGKQSKDIYGDRAIDHGWDESCMLNAVLCCGSSLVMKDGKVIKAEAVKEEGDGGSTI